MKLETWRRIWDLSVGRVPIWAGPRLRGLRMRVTDRLRRINEEVRRPLREVWRLFIMFAVILVWAALFSGLPGKQAIIQAFPTALVSSAVIFAIWIIVRGDDEEKWKAHNRPLDGPCRADNDPYISQLKIRGSSRYERENFLNDCRRTPFEAKNILLVLQQTGKEYWHRVDPYTIESITRQIDEIKEKEHKRFEKIEWVAFVSRADTFVAYQSMKKFLAELRKGNKTYADILNEETPEGFRNAIKHQREQDAKFKDGEPAEANFIPGLEIRYLYNQLPDSVPAEKQPDDCRAAETKESKKSSKDLPDCNVKLRVRDAIHLLQSNNHTETMLVSASERKPIGIVTLNILLNASATKEVVTSDQADLLKKRICFLDKITEGTIKECERSDQPKPSPDFGDDSPEREAMLPVVPRRAGTDLRFRLP